MIIGLYGAVVVISYLLGSIPFGLMISQRSAKTDLRNVGSGKIGMTNVLRAAGKKAAAVSLLLDMAKAAVAVIIAGIIFNSVSLEGTADDILIMTTSAKALAALAAIGGHSWSIFLGFKGGRGVATFMGGLLALYWPAALVGIVTVIIVGLVSRYMSLASITGSVATFIALLIISLLKQCPAEYLIYTIYAMIGAIFIFLMHRDNISRLVAGTERKLGDKAKVIGSSSEG